MNKAKDIAGKRFGKLLAIEKSGKDKSGSYLWICRCDCGNEVIVSGNSLRKNHTKSCGCIQKESAKETGYKNKKYNKYDLSGEYGIGYTSNKKEFYFDLEDYDKIKNYCWSQAQGNRLNARNENGKTILFHQLILVIDNVDLIIDHIDRNPLNNKKSNLRICTRQQNNMNCDIQKNNSSGITGVEWHKINKKWIAKIGYNKKTIYLGSFENKEEAQNARLIAEKKYFKEFSPNIKE
jgi:hypothetical protein